jgi:hypothetical protein
MSVSCEVKGLKPITDDYKKRLEIYKSCIELKISPPEEIRKYFEYDSEPCDEGIIVCLEEDAVSESIGYTSVYYDVDLSKLPDDVTKVRFEISY